MFIAGITAFNLVTAQTETAELGTYSWKMEVLLEPCEADGTLDTSCSTLPSKVGQKFRVVRVLDDSIVIRVLDYRPTRLRDCGCVLRAIMEDKCLPENKSEKAQISSNYLMYNTKELEDSILQSEIYTLKSKGFGEYQRYFKVSTKVFLEASQNELRHGLGFTAGVLNFPFKFRIQRGQTDFSGSFNVGTAMGLTMPYRDWRATKHMLLLGVSFTQVDLDSVAVSANHELLLNTNDFSALSMSIGYMIQNNSIQAGVFLGWDHLSRTNQSTFDWSYHGRPWVSFAIGIAIFSTESESRKLDKGQ